MKGINRDELDALLHSMQGNEVQLLDAPIKEYKRRKKVLLFSLLFLSVLLSFLSILLYRRK